MRKIFVIAGRDYRAAVRTKAFMITLLIMPLMMGGSILMQLLLKDQVDTTEKHFAVVDRTPGQRLYPRIAAALEARNRFMGSNPGKYPRFTIEAVTASADNDQAIAQQRYELSERVRHKSLFGFLEIGRDVTQLPSAMLVTESPAASPPKRGPRTNPVGVDDRWAVRYQSDSPTYDAFEDWVQEVLTAAIHESRFAAAHVTLPPQDLHTIIQPVPLLAKGLSKRNADGKYEDAPDENVLVSIMVPGGLMLLMFMLILLGATPLLQGVVEEKMQRIAEVLLGSVRPFELMMGKLLGSVAVSLTLAMVYLTGAYWAAHHYEFADYIPTHVIVWFVFYESLAVLMFGSLMIAVGAACTDMRETQSMMWPVMLLICLPMFVWINVIKDPNSTFSSAVSLVPFATPMLMLGRQAVPPGIPWWQPVLGISLVLITTLACVYAAGRIFRVGILMQGKGAQVGEILRWVVRG
jgi:ABC-2 type transport system permease protein